MTDEPGGPGGTPRRARPPRYKLSLPAVVQTVDGATYMTTVSVSRGGCGLAWSGPLPRVGAHLLVRVGSGRTAASLRATVRWVRDQPRALRVGVRFLGGEEARLAALLAQAGPNTLQE